MIRVENPKLFKNNPSNLKTLDRHLGKTFKSEEPSKEESKDKASTKLGFFGWRGKRDERKRLEKESEEKKLGEPLRLAFCNLAIEHELMYLDDNDPEYFKKVNEIEFKWRKRYGLV